MHRPKQYSRRECIKIPSSITNDLLEKHVSLIFEIMVMEAMDMVACHRLGKTGRVTVKLFNRKDAHGREAQGDKYQSLS